MTKWCLEERMATQTKAMVDQVSVMVEQTKTMVEQAKVVMEEQANNNNRARQDRCGRTKTIISIAR